MCVCTRAYSCILTTYSKHGARCRLFPAVCQSKCSWLLRIPSSKYEDDAGMQISATTLEIAIRVSLVACRQQTLAIGEPKVARINPVVISGCHVKAIYVFECWYTSSCAVYMILARLSTILEAITYIPTQVAYHTGVFLLAWSRARRGYSPP